jgi:hypothetical protein
LRPSRIGPFQFRGRTFVDNDGYAMADAGIAANAAGGAGLIACWRPTTSRPRAFSMAVTGAAQHVGCGLSATGSFFQVINSAGAAAVSTIAPALNRTHVAFAFWSGPTNIAVAVNHIQTLQSVPTPGVSLFATTSLCVGTNDQASGSRGDFIGQMFWIGSLSAVPPLGILHAVLSQQAPPTALAPWLVRLVPFMGTEPERCFLTRRRMEPNSGAAAVTAETIAAPRVQLVPPPLDDALGRLTKRYAFTVSYGGVSQTISATADAALAADAVLLKVPAGTDRTMGISLNGSPLVTVDLPSDANPQTGPLVMGTTLNAGLPVSDADQGAFMAVLASSDQDGTVGDRLIADARYLLAPVAPGSTITGPVATDLAVDLSAIIKDPAGEGYTVALGAADAGLTAVLDGTVLRYRGEAPGTYRVPVIFDSLHPLQPSTTVNLSVRLTQTGVTFANGYRYRRKVTRSVKSTVPAGNRLRFPVPIRINAQDWARSTLNGGKLEVASAIDLRVEDLAGNLLDFELRPGSDLATGTHALVVKRDTNPATVDEFWLYYGAHVGVTPEAPEDTYPDYYYIYRGGTDSRNPANPTRPWVVDGVATAPGLIGQAGDFSDANAEVSFSDGSNLSGVDRLDIVLVIKRPTATGENYGPLGIGDLSTEATSSLSVRDSTSSTTTNDAIRIVINTTGGRAAWRSPAGFSATTEWQVIGAHWLSGDTAGIVVHIDGNLVASAQANPSITGQTVISGPVIIGASGGAGVNGHFPGLIDEIRIGKQWRTPSWRQLEYLSFVDQDFVTLGPEEVPAAVDDQIVTQPDAVTATYVAGGSIEIDVLANDERSPPNDLLPLIVQNPTLTGDGICIVRNNRLLYTYPESFRDGGAVNGTYEVTDGTLVGYGTWSATIEPEGGGAVDTNQDLFDNPFGFMAFCHRPIGDNVQYGVPPGTLNPNVANPVYDLGKPGERGRVADIGGIILGTSGQGQKRKFRLLSDTPSKTIVHNGEGSGRNLPHTGPISPPGGDIQYHEGSGDRSVIFLIYQNPQVNWQIKQFNQFDYGASRTANGSARAMTTFNLRGRDVRNAYTDPGEWGPGAIDWRHPGGFLCDWEVDLSGNTPIQHVLNCTATRHSREGARTTQHLISRRMAWPAWNTDADADGNSTIRCVEFPQLCGGSTSGTVSIPNNQGDIPYGAVIAIRKQDMDLRNSTTANPVRGYALNLSPIGRVLFDTMVHYGMCVCDGQGQTANGGPRLQVRVDDKLAANTAKHGPIEMAFEVFRRNQLLWPIYNPRRHNAGEGGEMHTDGRPYQTGGGPISAKSVNSAYDA